MSVELFREATGYARHYPVTIFHRCLDELLETLSTADDGELAQTAMAAGAIEFTTSTPPQRPRRATS